MKTWTNSTEIVLQQGIKTQNAIDTAMNQDQYMMIWVNERNHVLGCCGEETNSNMAASPTTCGEDVRDGPPLKGEP